MGLFFKRWGHALGIISIPIQGLIYLWIGQNVGDQVFYNYYWIDTKIPFLTWFAVPYVVWMPVLYLGFLYIAIVNRSLYWRTLITYNVSVMICNLIFWFFPTYVPRPAVEGADLASWLVRLIYQNDAPLNCFPSVHCLTSYLLFITLIRHLNFKAISRIAWSTLLWLIIASTVFIKQHSIIDAAGGIIVAEAVYRFVHYYAAKHTHRPNKASATESM